MLYLHNTPNSVDRLLSTESVQLFKDELVTVNAEIFVGD